MQQEGRSSRTVAFRVSIGCAVALVAASLATGCKDNAKISAQKAGDDVTFLAKLADSDVGEVERGLPEGAKKLAALWAKGEDPKQDPEKAHTALIKIRRDNADLNIAKSTFFALADDKGVAIRNNLEQDSMAGQNLTAVFPDLAKVQTGGATWVQTTGAFPNTNPPGAAVDKDWIAAVPVKTDDGKTVGVFVTGWTYRRFAYHLQESLRHELSEKLRTEGDTGKLPVFYVMVFDKSGAYGAPHTPDVNEKAMADQDVVTKTANGPASGTLKITDRDFGWAAQRVPKLGADTGVLVLRSEL